MKSSTAFLHRVVLPTPALGSFFRPSRVIRGLKTSRNSIWPPGAGFPTAVSSAGSRTLAYSADADLEAGRVKNQQEMLFKRIITNQDLWRELLVPGSFLCSILSSGNALLHMVQTRYVQTQTKETSMDRQFLGVTKFKTTTTPSTRSTNTLRMSEPDSRCLEGGCSRSLVQPRAHSQTATLSSCLVVFWLSPPFPQHELRAQIQGCLSHKRSHDLRRESHGGADPHLYSTESRAGPKDLSGRLLLLWA